MRPEYDRKKVKEVSVKADMCVEERRFEDALDLFIEMESLWPDATYPILMRARCLAQLKRYQEAESCFNRCIELDPEHPTAKYFFELMPTGKWALDKNVAREYK